MRPTATAPAPDTPPTTAAGPVELERLVTVLTPESTVLWFALAGPGSRFAAALLDTLCQALLLLAVLAVAVGPWYLLGGRPDWAAATIRYAWPPLLVLAVAIGWGYHVALELAWQGQTPGKRALNLRVIRDSGHPVGLSEAAVRNLLRAVDLLPWVAPYLLGGLMMGLHPRCQRLGDQVAGTLVVRERPTPWLDQLVQGTGGAATSPLHFTAAQLERVTRAEVDVLTRFLERRSALPLPARQALANRLASPLRARLESPERQPIGSAEDWIEALQAAWVARWRR